MGIHNHDLKLRALGISECGCRPIVDRATGYWHSPLRAPCQKLQSITSGRRASHRLYPSNV